MVKFKKGQSVARKLSVMGIVTISFGHEVVSVGKNKMVVSDPSGDHHSSDYDPKTGNALYNYTGGFSYILTEEEAVKTIESGFAELDGGEEDYYFELLNRLEDDGTLDSAVSDPEPVFEDDDDDYEENYL